MATGLGFGYCPLAPGTVGALWGIPLAWCIMQIPSILLQILTIAVLFVIGVPICTSAARTLGKKDPAEVVWDEIATVPIAFLFLETRWMSRPEVLVLGFVLHRVFDISKPPPIKRFERLQDGLGIMADDVMAAAYACLSMHVLMWIGARIV